MGIGKNIVKWALACISVLCVNSILLAQQVGIEMHTEAQADTAKKEVIKEVPAITVEELEQLYNKNPDSIYSQYLHTLLENKQFKTAEKVVINQRSHNPQDLSLRVDMGDVYAWERRYDKAKVQYDSLLQMLNGDDGLTQRVVKTFTDHGNDDYALKALERTAVLTNAWYYYGMPLARLYDKCGRGDKTIEMLLIAVPVQGGNLETLKTMLLEMLGTDPAKLQQMQKGIVKKINDDPGNANYADLLTWIYTQKNDWDGALIQIEALDERNKESGRRLIELARVAANARQYDAAAKAYDDVIAQGKESVNYLTARSGRLSIAFELIKNDTLLKPAVIVDLAKQYDSLLVEYPQQYTTQTAADYAMLEAQYAGNALKALALLQRAITEPGIRQNAVGMFKLQMGDYYLLTGQLWDASLIYSQVDKEFKQDMLGEDARFRNAKLAYYRGDFVWAQRQLSVLKASTSQLIANDALYLSVLITENVEDSNYVPLERFANASLLLFENKDKEAESLLDSINKAYPKHPLNDDIIMARADLAMKHHNYLRTLELLKALYDKYGQDVLADDAVYKMAEIYRNQLHDIREAKHYYEQLIIDYPGSTYVQAARQHLYDLNNAVLP